jgi:uncharacterized protein YdiU (UPF0061 family)
LSIDELAEIFGGSALPEGAEPISTAYAGHQFGYFSMLGDGRAILLGEHKTSSGKRNDIQLKGSGRTPFSRRGDGRATLKSMLREYLMSECMFHLKIPSSRSLAVVKTGLPVIRETVHEGAVLTRVMASHIRVGTFEYARQYLEQNQLKKLIDYTIVRHYSEIENDANSVLSFLRIVMQRNLELVVNWMRIGFIHGVMNTDNISICGQTFDYGPCAFMNSYNTKTVFSSIDTQGRYAFGNQPDIMLWNLSIFAGTLLPFIHENEQEAIELAKNELNTFSKNFQDAWRKMMCAKIGFTKSEKNELILLDRLLEWMQKNQADYTNTFAVLMGELPQENIFNHQDFKLWKKDWETYLSENYDWEEAKELMSLNNPVIIPRNHMVEEALNKATLDGDFKLFDDLLSAVKSQEVDSNNIRLTEFNIDFDKAYQTFCGT